MEVRNPKVDFGCAEWCKFAEECIGADRAAESREALIRDRLIAEMRAACAGQEGRAGNSFAVLLRAEELSEGEGGDALVIKAAALLHDIADRDPAGTARAVLDRLGIDPETTTHVCRIIDSLQGGEAIDTIEARIVREATPQP